VLLLAGGGPKVLAGEFHPGGAWITTELSSTTDKAPGIAITGANSAIGVIRNTTFGNEVGYTTWVPGSFQAFTSIASAVTTQAAPSIAASGSRADVVFLGDNNKHYFAANTGAWSPTADPIGGVALQSTGLTPAAVTSIGSDTIVAFAGDNNQLYHQTRSGGAWLPAAAHINVGATVALTPAIVALTTGPTLMIAYVRNTDSKILFTTRTGNAWTQPAPIDANSFTADPVALAALPGGEAVLAFRGLDQKLYFSRYTPAGSPVWSLPGPLVSGVTTPSRPALAAGVGGFDAEVGFINSADSKAYHARLTGLTWSAPVLVGGTVLSTVAIASAP
jgi:hypothetical protein